MHSWPSPPIFLSIAIFLSCFVPPFRVSLSVFCTRKLHLLKSLFLDKNLNQIDLLIPTLIIFILRWRWWWQPQDFCWRSMAVVAARFLLAVQKGLTLPLALDGWVAAASVVLAVQKQLHWHLLIRVSCLFGLTLNSPGASDIVCCVLSPGSLCHHGQSQPSLM
jgi:hypothetical protein